VLEKREVLNGTWTAVTNLMPPVATGSGHMLLLPNGSVMVAGGGTANDWYELTPNNTGSYINGTWTTLASMATTRLYYASDVLPTGKVFVEGGEYTNPASSNPTDGNTGEMYNIASNTWSPIATYPNPAFGDGISELLNNGNILTGDLNTPDTYIYDPATNTWLSPAPQKLHGDSSGEESWVKLANGDILTYAIGGSQPQAGQIFNPATDTWSDAGTVPVQLDSSGGGPNYPELGPAFLLPNGNAFFIGASGHTAWYDPSTNIWTAGPDIPGGLGAFDAPGAMEPNGNIIFAAGPINGITYPPPTSLFEYDPVANTMTAVTSPDPLLPTTPPYSNQTLVLPTGQVLFSDGSTQLWIYTPLGGPQAAWQPTISGIVNNGANFTLTGTQINGISEGAAYGDDAQMASNYPIIQLTNQTGNVTFATTSNWSSAWVQTGATPETTQFTTATAPGAYLLSVSGAGISSNNVLFVQMGAGANNITLREDPTQTKIQVLQGAGVIDTYPLNAFTSIVVAGDAGADTLTIDASNGNPVGAGGLTYDGGGGNNTLVGPNTTNTWTVTGVNSGNLDGNITFTNVGNLTGGSGNDTFVFQAAGKVTGNVDGGAGYNVLDITATGTTATTTGPGTLVGFQGNTGGPGTTIGGIWNNINSVLDASDHLAVTTQPPANVIAGAGFTVVVSVENALGVVDASINTTMTIALLANPGGSTLGGLTSVACINGVATFSGLSLNKVGTGYTLQAALGSLTATTTQITVSAAAAAQLGVTSQPASVATGSAFSLVVSEEDQYGNPITTYNGTVTIAVLTGPSTNLGGTLTVTAHNGVANFSGLTLTTLGTYTIQATAQPGSGLAPGTSNPIVVTNAPASQLVVFTQPPLAANLGLAFGPVVIQAEDKYGNLATNFNGTVQLSVASGPTSAIGGTVTATAVGGIATFSGVILNTAGTYVLLASSVGLNSVKTTSITINGPISTTASLSGTLGSNGWYVSSVLVTLTASGGFNGVAATYYSLDPSGTPTFTKYTGPFSVGNSGINTLYWYSVDNTGNIEATHGPLSFKIDTATPLTTATLTGTQGNPGYYLSSVGITLTASVGVSGLSHTYYTLDGGALKIYSGPITATLQGNNTLTYYSVDNNGLKESAHTTTFNINSVTPTLTIVAPPVNSASPTIGGSPEGSLSGTTEAGATVSVVISDSATPKDTVTASATANSLGQWSLLYNAGTLIDGSLLVQATASDAAGHNVAGSKTTTKSMQVIVSYMEQPASVLAGVYMSPVIVQLRDAFGNAMNLAGKTVSLTVAGASFTGPVTEKTNSVGQATFSDLLFSSSGTFNLMISGTGMTAGKSSSFTIGKQSLLFWR